MSKQYYLCDILPPDATDDSYRPAVAALGVSWTGIIPTGADGRPLHTWALVIVASRDHARVRAAQGVDPMPDFPLDGKVSAVNAGTTTAMKAALTRRGLAASSIVDGKDGYREVIRAVGKSLDAGFDENKFDIADV